MYLLEGNIGVGKTTMLSLLPGYFPDLEIVPEPRDMWSRSVFGQSLLSNYYQDPKRWSYTLETFTMICRSQNHANAIRRPDKHYLFERSIYSGHYCFATTGFKNGFLSDMEWKIYNNWVDFLIHTKSQPPKGFIYLKAKPEICFDRVQKRNHPTEQAMTLEYLKQIGRAHDDFLLEKKGLPEHLKWIPVLTLDCNEDFSQRPELMDGHAEKMTEFFRQKL